MGIGAPASDQLELTLIGPGFGECAVIHVGGGKWVVIDSCMDNTANPAAPAALRYLKSLGVSVADSVGLIVATHWHDDHVRGLAQILEDCPNAQFCASSALGAKEFVAMVSAYSKERVSKSSSGVKEIHAVYEILSRRRQVPLNASPDRPVYLIDAVQSGHGHQAVVTTLSPSDLQITKFHSEIAGLMPSIGKTRQRCVPQKENHLAVATWIGVGPVAFLLGSDLQETADPRSGWSVIVDSKTKPRGTARIFKIPHHGAENAHNEAVWREMLVSSPFAILTPFNRGLKTPTKSDVKRIDALTTHAYATSKLAVKRAKRRNPAVDRSLREGGITILESEPSTGLVRLRNRGVAAFDEWHLELLNGACRLEEVHQG